MSVYISEPFVQRGELVVLLEDYPVPDLRALMHTPEDRLGLSHVQALRTYLLECSSIPSLQTKIW